MNLNKPFHPKAEETAEARRLVAALSSQYDRLKLADQRYVASLTEYLSRKGEETVWGTHRLTLLRKIHGQYCATETTEQEIEKI